MAFLFLGLSSVPTPATDRAFKRVTDAALSSPILPKTIVKKAKAICDTALCFAETLAKSLPDHVRLEPIDHPDTDSIRWAKTNPSVTAEKTAGGLGLKLSHFGRKALPEIREALEHFSDKRNRNQPNQPRDTPASGDRERVRADASPTQLKEGLAVTDTDIAVSIPVKIDLRGNAGGDFERMLEIAGLLIGPRLNAIEIDHGDHIEHYALNGTPPYVRRIVSVEVDQKTASAALLLARLLKTHTGARLIGPSTIEKPVFLKRRITVDHNWRLILPIAETRIISP